MEKEEFRTDRINLFGHPKDKFERVYLGMFFLNERKVYRTDNIFRLEVPEVKKVVIYPRNVSIILKKPIACVVDNTFDGQKSIICMSETKEEK